MKRISIVTLLLLILTIQVGAVTLRRDFANLESAYLKGDLDSAVDMLNLLKPTGDEERAFVIFYSAMLKSSSSEAILLHKQNCEKFPSAHYAQKSMMELAKLNILSHETDSALAYLRRITSSELNERFYWLAMCSAEKDIWQDVINHGENYLKVGTDEQMVENCYFLIADAYMRQKKYLSAASTLTRLGSAKGHPIDEQRYYYSLAYAYESGDKIPDALAAYRRAYEINKFSQLAYQIEDRLFDLRSGNSNVDISFLYPYTELVLPDSVGTETPPPVTPVNPVVSDGQPQKTSGRPSSGYYLQAGRFSVSDNAFSRAKEILAFGYPSLYFEEKQNGKSTWVVMSGPFTSQIDADGARTRLLSSKIDCFTVKY